MKRASILNKIQTITNSKYFLYIFAITVLILAISVKIELVEPLLILFVIYTSLNYSKKTVIISLIYSIIVLGIQDIFTLHLDIAKYLIEVVMLIIISVYIIISRSEISEKNFKLRERVKELNGLINITKILEKTEISFDQSLNMIINQIRTAWQYPKDTCVRINYEDKEYITDNFKESKWKMDTDIIIDGQEKGKIEVFYLKEHKELDNSGPFLKEEYNLIEAISNRLSDLIKRHEQEIKIRENKNFLEITLNSIGDAVIVTDNKGYVVKMNYVSEQLTGWKINDAREKDITKIFKIVNSKTNKKIKNPIKRVLKKGKIVSLANHTKLISKDGKEYHIADSAAPIKDENNNIHGAVIVFRNYSEKYELNNEIKRREKLFANAIKEAPYPIMIHAEDGEVFRINDQWTELSGYDYDDIKHIDQWFEQAYPEKRNMVKEFVDNLFTLNKKVHDGEFEITTKDGDKRLWDFSSVPLGKTDDNRKLIMSMAVDITEREKMIKSIKKLNRLYSILSDINQTIVRTKNKKSLFDQVCNIIINKGGYKSIWVGEISKVKDNLHIVSASGQNSDLIKDLDIDFKDQKNIELIRNLLGDFKLEENMFDKFINNEEVNYRNIIYDKKGRSIAIFPIMVFSKIWGIMTACIDQEKFFDQEEFKLFKELTDDLSYAVQALINHKLRKKSEDKLRESERRYRELFEKAPIGIFKTNSGGNILMINPEMANILGYDDIDQVIESYNDLAKNLYVDMDKRRELIENIKEKGFVIGFIYRAYDKNENIRWLRMDARISKFNEDGSFTIDGFIEDITEQYQIQKELEKSEEKYRTLFENQYS
ncbi:MAG: PAS domain S-box protein, partial [Halanaerobiales bacterium]|nr:PAS domain S-box protein [Halanaerobiales bacterium]